MNTRPRSKGVSLWGAYRMAWRPPSRSTLGHTPGGGRMLAWAMFGIVPRRELFEEVGPLDDEVGIAVSDDHGDPPPARLA
jgi:hypothetical protein